MIDPARRVANTCARIIADVQPEGRTPALVCVVLVHENGNGDPLLEIDASTRCDRALTPRGAAIVVEFSRRLRQAIEDTARDMAREHGHACARRIDIERALAESDDVDAWDVDTVIPS